MLYIVLQYLVRLIKKNIPCQQCKTKYNLKDFDIIDLLEGELFMEMDCKNCGTKTMIVATINENHKGIQFIQNPNDENRKIEKTIPISKEDVDVINNQLEEYKGGFKALFANKSNNKKKKL